MNPSKSVSSFLYELIFRYTSFSMYIFEVTINPIINFTDNYSPTIAKTMEKTLKPIYKFIMTLPIFLPIMALSIFIFNDYGFMQTNLYGIDVINLLSVIFVVMSIITVFTAKYIYNKNTKKTVLLGSMIFTGAIILQLMSPPYVYLHIVALVYAIGAYSTSLIEFKYQINSEDRKEPQHYGWADVIVYGIISVPLMWLINNPIIDSIYFVFALIGLLTFVAFRFTYEQKKMYRQIYNHQIPEKSSRRYLFPAKMSIIYATGITFISLSVNYLTAFLFMIPAITFITFSEYMTKNQGKKVNLESRHNLQKSIGKQGGRKPNTEMDIDYSSSSKESDETYARVSFTVDLEIPKNMPENKDIWMDFATASDSIYNIINHLETENTTNEKIKEYPQFYTHISQIMYDEMREENVDIDELENLPELFRMTILENLHKTEDKTMNDIADLSLVQESVEFKNSKFFSNIPEDS